MTDDSTPKTDTTKRRKFIVQVFVGAVVLPLVLLAVGGCWTHQLAQRYKQVKVGMTVEEVVDLLGETTRHSRAGEPLKPPVVTVKPGTAYEYAYTWFLYPAKYVIVLFDEHDRVVAIYTYDS